LQKKIEETMNVSKDQFLKCCDKYLPQEIALFVKEQVFNKNKRIKGRRYSLQYKELCLNMFFKGPKTYRALSSIFFLPSRRTLNRMTTNIFFTSGMNKSIFDLLSIKVTNMQETEKYCTVMFDEMSLKCHLYYDIKADEIIVLATMEKKNNFNQQNFHVSLLQQAFLAVGNNLLHTFKYSLSKYSFTTIT